MTEAWVVARWLWATLSAAGLARPIPCLHLIWMVLRHGMSLYSCAALWASRVPDDLALIDDTKALSWRELIEDVDALVGAFSKRGIEPGYRVGILCRNHIGFALTFLALMRVGADIILINTRFNAKQLDETLDQYAIGTVVLDHEYKALLRQTAYRGHVLFSGPPSDTHESEPNIFSLLADAPRTWIMPRRCGTLTVLTSGTTGRSKGVARRPSLVQFAGALYSLTDRLALQVGGCTFITVPLFHGYGVAALALAMGFRTSTVLTRDTKGPALRMRAKACKATTIVTVPTLLSRMLQASEVGAIEGLLRIVSGSAPLPCAVARDAREQFGSVLYNLYGSTEAGLLAIAAPSDFSPAHMNVGRPVCGVQIFIRCTANKCLPPGEIGEVSVMTRLDVDVRAPGASSSSHRRHARTTGDRGYFDHTGCLCLLGRMDDLIIVGGEKIYPQQVEELLLSLPQVVDAAVLAVSNDYGEHRLGALLVLHPGEHIKDVDVSSVLPGYMQLSQIHRTDYLPRNAIGKLQREKLYLV